MVAQTAGCVGKGWLPEGGLAAGCLGKGWLAGVVWLAGCLGKGWLWRWIADGRTGCWGRLGWSQCQARKTPMSPEAVRARTEIYGSPGSGWLMASMPMATRPETELRSSQVAS